MNGNWSQLDITSLGVRSATASLALTGFWAAVTAGRVLLAAIQRWLPSRAAYHGLPFLLAGAFVLIAVLPRNAPAADVAAFCLAGLGCSALLPLTISFGQEKLAGSGAVVAGGVIACYQAATASPRSAWARWSAPASGCRRSSRPARSWPWPWVPCPWWSRVAGRRRPRCIPVQHSRGRASARPLALARSRRRHSSSTVSGCTSKRPEAPVNDSASPPAVHHRALISAAVNPGSPARPRRRLGLASRRRPPAHRSVR